MPPIKNVLLMRVIAHAELHNTREAPDIVKRAFPGARLAALGAADCEDTTLLAEDARIDDLLLMPPGLTQSPRAFRRFMSGQPCDATVMCCGATPGVNYPKQILASLACPGRHYFLNAAGELFPARSLRGWGVVLRAGASVAAFLALHLTLMLLALVLRLLARTQGAQADLPEPQNVKRLLFIRLDHIGDVAMSLPALRALRRFYPNARIDALALPSVAPLLADVPDIDTVIPYAAPVFTRGGRHAGLRGTLALLRRLRRARYCLAVDLRGNDLCRLLAFFSGATRRIGPRRSLYETSRHRNYDFLLTHPVDAEDGVEHAVARNVALLRACGVPTPPDKYRLEIRPERTNYVCEVLDSLGVGGAYAVIHGRPSEESREWGAAQFAAVADRLAQGHGLPVLLSGAPQDRDYNVRIQAQMRFPEGAINVAGHFSLPDLPALLAGASLMVSVDTGPMHLAALCGTPLVTLFHPGLARLHHPYNQPESVLTPTTQKKLRPWDSVPLSAIAVEDVLALVDARLHTSAKIALRLVSNSAAEIYPSSRNSFSRASLSLSDDAGDAAAAA